MLRLSQLIFKLIGWKVVGHLPDAKKYILIVAPHTSNWDFVIGLCARFVVGVKINFIAKHQLFVFPLNIFFKAVGGAPVDRSKKGNKVEQIVELFNRSEAFRLAIAPEGTRSPVRRWKEGFYHIADQAKIPIVMIGLDYPSKEVRISEPFTPGGDIQKDFSKILAYFRAIRGRYPKEIPDYHSKDEP